MWLDAFKPKSGNMQNMRVSGVNGVSPGKKPMNSTAFGYEVRLTPENISGVMGVSEGANSNTADTPDTGGHHDKNRCQSIEIDHEPSIHAGDSGSLTPLTPLTPQENNDRNGNDKIDVVCEFMAIDGLTLAEAQALAEVSIQPRPAGEWLALIDELDALIERYSDASGLTDEAKAAILSTRSRQSLVSIPESLAWFRAQVAALETRPNPAEKLCITGSRYLGTYREVQVTSTQSTPEKHPCLFNRAEQFAMLAPLRLETVPTNVKAHVDAGHAAEEIGRVNNMAFHLIVRKGWTFDAAMASAAKYVAFNQEHPDEQQFTDVMVLFQGGAK